MPHPDPLPDWLGVVVAGGIALGYLVPYLLWTKVLAPRLDRHRTRD